MKQLTCFELYKVFRQKTIYILSIILLCYLTLVIILNSNVDDSSKYKQFEGPISSEVIRNIGSINTDDGFINIPSNIHARMAKNVKIHKSIHNHRNSIEEKLLQTHLNNYSYRSYSLELSLLKDIPSPVYFYDSGLQDLIEYSSVIAILIGILLTLGLANIFTIESTTGVNQILLCSKRGRKQIVTAKIIAALLFTFFVWLSLNLFSLFITKLIYGGFGWDSLLQYLPLFERSPYPLTLGQYYMLLTGFQLIAALCLSLFIMFISALSKNALVSFFISGFVFVNLIWMDFDVVSESEEKILSFSFYGLMKVNSLFKSFDTFNLFGYPLLFPVAGIILIAIFSLIFIKILYAYQRQRDLA